LGGLPLKTVQETDEWVNLMVYGESGVGKTRFAGSADMIEAMSPVLLVDAEGGSMTLKSCYPEVDVVRIHDTGEINSLYQDLAKGAGQYKTVILDSLTEIQKMSMDDIMRKAVAANSEVDRDVPQIRHWGINKEQTRRIVRAYRDLPMHTIFICLPREVKDRRNLTVTKPGLGGTLAGEIAGFLDIVLYMYIKVVKGEQTRLMLSTATEGQTAKDRSDALPGVIENPTMQTIWDYVQGEKTKSAEATVDEPDAESETAAG
jgi:hypothetical protein